MTEGKKYEVQTYTIYGWVNCWHEEDESPVVFDSIEEAQREIDDFLSAVWEAGMRGYYKEDYRIVEATP